MLEISGLRSGYGWLEVVKNVSLEVRSGEIILILGKNGAGKTTLLKTVVGHIKPWSGKIFIDGMDVTGHPPHDIASLKVSYVPQNRGVFSRLTVEENLKIADKLNSLTVEEAVGLFPELKPLLRRRAGELSGGEQQTLAVARALASRPRLLVMDEPATGLMPKIIWRMVAAVKELRGRGASALIVEQNPAVVYELADRIALMEGGEIKTVIDRERLSESQPLLRRALGLPPSDME
ncbi:MAG: ABC transporter ATP-binding protein [Nitrososphaerota archaeon]|nr:ABC transporter ATP-binding protein [Candidatus Calditenuaceae archaeon]MDW8073740.1 ABC transporter ATP-binding protein [Nitrososphaerota archaeon]